MSIMTCRARLHSHFMFSNPAYQTRWESTTQYARLFNLLRNPGPQPQPKPIVKPAPQSSPFDDIIGNPNPSPPPWFQVRQQTGEAGLSFLRASMAIERGHRIRQPLIPSPVTNAPQISFPSRASSTSNEDDDLLVIKNKLQSVIASLDDSIAANRAALSQLDKALMVSTHALQVAKGALDRLAQVGESIEKGRERRKPPEEEEVQEILDDIWSSVDDRKVIK